MPDFKRTINLSEESTNNTADLLQNIAKELYSNNLALNKERGRLDEILSSVVEAIFAVNENLQITLFNHRAEEIFETEEKNAVGKKVSSIAPIYHEHGDVLINPHEYLFKDKISIIDRIKTVNKSGRIQYFNLKSTFIDYGDGKKEAVVALSNVTHEVELEKQKDDFISMASHELKTPISIVVNNLWMYKNTTSKKFTEKELLFLSQAEEGLDRLKKTVNNLLDISRIQQGRLMFDIKDMNIFDLLVNSTKNMNQVVQDKKIKIVLPRKRNAKVTSDPNKIAEVIDNLLSNAIKYGKDQIKIDIKKEKTLYKISVKDNGHGIAKKDYVKIFTRFGRGGEGLRLANPGASTGLGLFISKLLVNELGGEIGFKSTWGKGTVFWFTIPINPSRTLLKRAREEMKSKVVRK